jgi:hypothetical protein
MAWLARADDVILGQKILESIVLQIALAKGGSYGPIELSELVAEAVTKGKVSYLAVINKMKSTQSKSTSNYATDHRPRQNDSRPRHGDSRPKRDNRKRNESRSSNGKRDDFRRT